MNSAQADYEELSYYTLAHSSPEFIHQYSVDAFTAQTADEHTRPIAVAFALVGLYLHLEKGYTGREVQRMHRKLANRRRTWPKFPLPVQRGAITIADVLAQPSGRERDLAIDEWCASVWDAWNSNRKHVMALLQEIPEFRS